MVEFQGCSRVSVNKSQVYTGKEREVILAMILYLRLGYVSDPSEMQSAIFSEGPVCTGSTELQLGSWKFEDGGESLKRLVTYVKAPSKLIKAIKVVENFIARSSLQRKHQ